MTVIIKAAGQCVETSSALNKHYPYRRKVKKKQFILLAISFNVKVVIPIILVFQM